MLVIIEGIDFSGKTTITKLLKDLLEKETVVFTWSSTCLSYKTMGKLVGFVQDHGIIPAFVRAFVFNFAIIFDSLFWVDSGIHIQEGYFMRVKSFNIASERIFYTKLQKLVEKIEKKPDLAFLLTCPFGIRKERFLKSNSKDIRDRKRFNECSNFHLKKEKILHSLSRDEGYIEIKTDVHSQYECALFMKEKILEAIKEAQQS